MPNQQDTAGGNIVLPENESSSGSPLDLSPPVEKKVIEIGQETSILKKKTPVLEKPVEVALDWWHVL